MRNALLPIGVALTLASPLAVSAHPLPSPAVSSVTITHSGSKDFGGPFALMDQNGRPVSSGDFRGMPMLIYFGYTNCTDACPLDAQAISNVVDALDRQGITLAPIFITVDPERDTPARLKEFLSAFHPRFVGLTGPAERVLKVATAYGASGEGDRVNEQPDGRYDVLHAAVAYLMGRDGKFIEIIHLNDPTDAIVGEIARSVATPDGRR